MRRSGVSTILVAACAVAGCGDDGGTMPAAAPAAYYSSGVSAALGAAGNTSTCATCHSSDGTPRSGETLRNIVAYVRSGM